MRNESEILFELFCEQRSWGCEYLDGKYPGNKTPDYLVSAGGNGDFYAEVKEISNNRLTDQIAARSSVFTMSAWRLFGWAEWDATNALEKIKSLSETPFYKPLPFVLIVYMNQAFVDQDINLYKNIFDKFESSNMLSAFGFLRGDGTGQETKYYLDLARNAKAKFAFPSIDFGYCLTNP